jgi:geranylgeranyl pyrophosphate synthase
MPAASAVWQRMQSLALREEIEGLLGTLTDWGNLREVVGQALSESRLNVPSPVRQSRPWALLPMMVCDCLSGDFRQAVPLAAALELLKAAAEVFDDVEDADSSASLAAHHGPAIATNAGTTLVILAERALARLKEVGVSDKIAVEVFAAVNAYYARTCTGQHLDLSLPPEKRISEEMYFRIIELKTASAVECACAAAALLGTRAGVLVDLFAAFGRNLGMACQVANDIQGITTGTDTAARKITLPVIYALSQTEGETLSQFESTFIQIGGHHVLTSDKMTDLLLRTGAIQYATVKMEYYRLQAREALEKIKAAGVKVETLYKLIS